MNDSVVSQTIALHRGERGRLGSGLKALLIAAAMAGMAAMSSQALASDILKKLAPSNDVPKEEAPKEVTQQPVQQPTVQQPSGGTITPAPPAPAPIPTAGAVLNGAGWTDLIPSGDSRIIYVSSSQGNDSNDGMSPQSPVRTIAKGYSLLRDNHPDWLLLRRGDMFTGEPLRLNWDKSGRSKSEPMVVSSYGSLSQRPKILTPPSNDGLNSNSASTRHLRFVGLHLEPHNRQPSHTPRGIRWLGSVTDILIEDCYIGGYRENLIFQVWNNSQIKDVRIRRSVVVDAWSASSAHSQGIFAKLVEGLLLEENVFDHNGWHPTISGAEPTIYNHNIYIQRDNTDVVVRGNIMARASGSGVQQRPGGLMENNLAIQNPSNLQFGAFQNSWPSQGVKGIVRNNVVLDGADINASNPLGRGIWLQQILEAEVYGNVVARQATGTANVVGIIANYNYQNVTIRDNVVWDWDGGSAMRFLGNPGGKIIVKNNVLQQPNGSDLVRHNVSWGPFTYSGNTYYGNKSSPFDPGSNFNGWVSQSGESGGSWQQIQPQNSCSQAAADLFVYMQCIGHTPTYEAFLAEARKQSRMNWRPEFTAAAVNSFIRASHGLPPQGK